MDPALIAVSMHSLERIVAVLLGGLAVYYGFRLFLALPTELRADGKINLPGMAVVFSKAGPGLFFAAFGALVILASLFRPIEIKDQSVEYRGVAPATSADAPGVAPRADPAGLQQETARVQLALQSLNCLQRLGASRAKSIAGDLDQATREAKVALIAHVWRVEEWGEFGGFEKWASGRASTTVSPAKALFEAQRIDCPD